MKQYREAGADSGTADQHDRTPSDQFPVDPDQGSGTELTLNRDAAEPDPVGPPGPLPGATDGMQERQREEQGNAAQYGEPGGDASGGEWLWSAVRRRAG